MYIQCYIYVQCRSRCLPCPVAHLSVALLFKKLQMFNFTCWKYWIFSWKAIEAPEMGVAWDYSAFIVHIATAFLVTAVVSASVCLSWYQTGQALQLVKSRHVDFVSAFWFEVEALPGIDIVVCVASPVFSKMVQTSTYLMHCCKKELEGFDPTLMMSAC